MNLVLYYLIILINMSQQPSVLLDFADSILKSVPIPQQKLMCIQIHQVEI